jgi:hypothetical protein
LKEHPPKDNNEHFTRLYESTIKKLSEVFDITQNAVINAESEILLQSPVEQIYEITQLKYGTVVIQARLDMVIRLALMELIQNSTPEDQVLVAQLLAAERFTETLSKMSGTDNLASIKADINRAQPTTISNLTVGGDVLAYRQQILYKNLCRLHYIPPTGPVLVPGVSYSILAPESQRGFGIYYPQSPTQPVCPWGGKSMDLNDYYGSWWWIPTCQVMELDRSRIDPLRSVEILMDQDPAKRQIRYYNDY